MKLWNDGDVNGRLVGGHIMRIVREKTKRLAINSNLQQ